MPAVPRWGGWAGLPPLAIAPASGVRGRTVLGDGAQLILAMAPPRVPPLGVPTTPLPARAAAALRAPAALLPLLAGRRMIAALALAFASPPPIRGAAVAPIIAPLSSPLLSGWRRIRRVSGLMAWAAPRRSKVWTRRYL